VIFLDTSVLIATAQVNHEHHTASCQLWNRCTAQLAAVSTHTLAEVYSTLTSMPPVLRLAPCDAVTALEVFLKRLTPVTLTAEEYMETLAKTASMGHSGGMIYDALHLACARKIGAEQIFTCDVRHFRMLAPDLAERIVTPEFIASCTLGTRHEDFNS
jgi:predicted nucleic acid-binding protein